MPGPLQGFTVVTLALNVPGPVAAASLRDDGARIVKIEPPAGDPLAWMAPGWYANLHQGVEVRPLNLKTPEGTTDLLSLLTGADLLLTSFRPSALERLGLGRTLLDDRYPALCRVLIVGDRRAPEEPGHDLTYQVEAGLIDPAVPVMPRTLLADMVGSREAYAAALALLLGRERGSAARERVVGLADAARFAAQPFTVGLTAPGGMLSGAQNIYRLYRTADGWVAAAPLEARFAQRWAEVIGPDAGSVIARHPTAHWLTLARANDLPLVAVEARES
ncbi:CoA transferase [Deinococcus sp. KSM4-11]|uniref:CoA transferase n=1 Tax=Deinococcus sp. KSM4-11 TaxID=2568654 RepID=UPI0010A34FD8|nr:CoA transferase [Deinococcus sp. KSM4-11]THF85852.1 CoA transferase [Deinococcus sp. KSM4-11]